MCKAPIGPCDGGLGHTALSWLAYEPATTYVPAASVAAFSQSLPVRIVRAVVVRLLCRWCPGVVGALLFRRRESFWYRTSRSPGPQRVWGYVNVHGIEPGEGFHLMLSTRPDRRIPEAFGHVEVFRVGFYGETDRELVLTSGSVRVGSHQIGNTAAAVGPNWPVSLVIDATGDWRTGYHSIDFVHADGERERDIAFLVVTERSRRVDVVVKLATATYQAYNRWGGHNLYAFESPSKYDTGRMALFESEHHGYNRRGGHDRSAFESPGEYDTGMALFESDRFANIGSMVSFDRPTPSEFWEWEYYFVLWIEEVAKARGITLAYTTNYDFATREDAADCRLLVSVGHDEYWTKEEFDRHHDRIFEEGGNTLFLGSNTAYWQVRYVDVNGPDHRRGRQMICHKSLCDPITDCVDADPILHATARFRDGARRPETMLLGVGYQSNLEYRRQLEPRWPYYVVDTDLPFFRETGLAVGDAVADVIGHEWDNRDPESEHPAPGEPKVEATDRLWHAEKSKIDPIPADRIQVVFAGDAIDVFGHKGRAEAVYYESDAGAKVFSAGTNRWTWGLNKDGYADERFRRFNENLVLDFLAD